PLGKHGDGPMPGRLQGKGKSGDPAAEDEEIGFVPHRRPSLADPHRVRAGGCHAPSPGARQAALRSCGDLLAGSQTCYRLSLKMARFVLAAAFLLAAPLAVRAGPLHSWVDEEGVYHVSDTPPPKTRKSPRALRNAPSQTTRPEPPQSARARRAPRWWEKR